MSEEQYKKIFSKNLKYFMDLHGKTQSDIIHDLGFDKSAVSTWCNGTRLPRMDKVDALAKYFHIKRSALIEDEVISHSQVPPSFVLTEEEEIILSAYRNADALSKELVHRTLGISSNT